LELKCFLIKIVVWRQNEF